MCPRRHCVLFYSVQLRSITCLPPVSFKHSYSPLSHLKVLYNQQTLFITFLVPYIQGVSCTAQPRGSDLTGGTPDYAACAGDSGTRTQCTKTLQATPRV